MRSLVFVGDAFGLEAARRHAAAGTRLYPWTEAVRERLAAAGLAPVDPLDTASLDAVDEAAMSWTRECGRRSVHDGKSLRDLLAWNGVALWWAAEIYLHYTADAPRYVRLVDSFHRILERETPDEVEALGLDAEPELLLARTCVARRILFHGTPRAPAGRIARATLRVSLLSRLNTVKAALTALKAVITRRPAARADGPAPVVFLSHAAFWRERTDPESGERRAYEHYFDTLIPSVAGAGLQPFVLAVGPRAAFRRRGTAERLGDWLRLGQGAAHYDVHLNRYAGPAAFAEQRKATAALRQQWRRLRGTSGMNEAFSFRGVSFADLAGPSLAGTLLLQLPWAVGLYAALHAALSAAAPSALCLYAESSGLGRVALAAGRALGIPSVAVQHGIIYPKYYSYRHAADEAGCPRPDRTALFGHAAERFLVAEGGYAPESLVVTGSPKFDDLVAASRALDRSALRARFGAGEADRLLLVASRYRGIRETHQSIGSAFAAFVRAVETMDGVHAVVKPHPAEPDTAYAQDVRRLGATRTTVVESGADLMELLVAADALVTVESLSAVEALVLGRPVLVLNTPTNLQELVASGAAIGVPRGEDPGEALRRLLFDTETRSALAAARDRYLDDVAHGVDGHAAERIAALLQETALNPRRGRV